jgi:FlaA1/EpsC-like NDP-sugar epimerase
MSVAIRTTVKLFIDLALMNAATFIACVLRFDGQAITEYRHFFAYYLPMLLLFRTLALCSSGVYRSLWRYASIEHVTAAGAAITVGTAAFYGFVLVTGAGPYPLSALIIDWLVCLALMAGTRICFRGLLRARVRRCPSPKRVLVVGAGDAGAAAVAEMKRQRNGRRPIGFVDDDPDKAGRLLHGLLVMGESSDIPNIIRKHRIDEILITLASQADRLNEIVGLAKGATVSVRMLPGIHEIMSGETRLQHPETVKPEDLLERRQATVDVESLGGSFKGKRILVSGAGGSIGSELCRQIAKFNPSALYLLDQGENGIFEVEQELKAHTCTPCKPVVADVKDASRLDRVFAELRPEVVFHAAAHKHVPMMEMYPEEAVKNNVFGTRNMATCASRHGCERFVLISTDKAVKPSSVMGATKRAAETIVQYLSKKSKTCFLTVRFGNVLNSRGSLLPTLKRQIAEGGPVTITHPAMERYFMTIPEAVMIVLQAAAHGRNGQLMVLDMGKPVSILQLADKLIRLCGKVPGQDIEIRFTGVRPGEKITEELFTSSEKVSAEQVGELFVVPPEPIDLDRFRRHLATMERDIHQLESAEVRERLRGLVPDYSPVTQSGEETLKVAILEDVSDLDSDVDDLPLPAAA